MKIAVDLDGTLAHYEKWVSHWHIGPPVVPMLEAVRAALEAGAAVVIFTARVDPEHPPHIVTEATNAINKWCREHLGRTLPITAIKSHTITEFWDDRAVRVEKNKGLPATSQGTEFEKHLTTALARSML